MTQNRNTDDDAELAALLDSWQAPPASPWLAGRIASQVIAGAGVAAWPFSMRTRMAALALAVVIGWGIGAVVTTPEPPAESIELAGLLW